MSLSKGLRDELLADATVYGIVGSKVWREFGRQSDARPYLIITRTSMQTTLTLDGVDTLRNIGFRIDCYADTISQVETLATAVRTLLDGKTGSLGNEPIQFMHLESQQDLSDLEGDKAIRRINLQFNLMAHEG